MIFALTFSLGCNSSIEQEFSNYSVYQITWIACSSLIPGVGRSSELAGLGLGLRICIPGEFPGVADETGSERARWERQLCKILLNVISAYLN